MATITCPDCGADLGAAPANGSCPKCGQGAPALLGEAELELAEDQAVRKKAGRVMDAAREALSEADDVQALARQALAELAAMPEEQAKAVLAHARRLAQASPVPRSVTAELGGIVAVEALSESLGLCESMEDSLAPANARTWRRLFTFTVGDAVDLRNKVIGAVLVAVLLRAEPVARRDGNAREQCDAPNRVEQREMTPTPPAPALPLLRVQPAPPPRAGSSVAPRSTERATVKSPEHATRRRGQQKRPKK